MRKNDVMKPDGSGLANGDNNRFNNLRVMRYAEVLLMYAEACLQTGDNAEAKKYINEIQKRAGSKTISETVDMQVLMDEKQYELWFEGARFHDLVRWAAQGKVNQLETMLEEYYEVRGWDNEGIPTGKREPRREPL